MSNTQQEWENKRTVYNSYNWKLLISAIHEQRNMVKDLSELLLYIKELDDRIYKELGPFPDE